MARPSSSSLAVRFAHPLLEPLRLAAIEPMVFWRHRWHWPWWDAGTFDRLVSEGAESVVDLHGKEADSEGKRGEMAPGPLLVREQPHPAVWAAEELAARLDRQVVVLREGSDAGTAAEADDAAGIAYQVEDASNGSQQPRLATTPRHLAASLVLPSRIQSSAGHEHLLDIGSQRLPAEEPKALAEVLPTWEDSSGGRPVVLLGGGCTSWASRVAMAWGAAHRACWLFGDAGDPWVDDLIWARPHALFAGADELAALLARSNQKGALRQLKRGLSRCHLAVFASPPAATRTLPSSAQSEHWTNHLVALQERLDGALVRNEVSVRGLRGGRWC